MHFDGITRRSFVAGGFASLALAGGLATVRPVFAQDDEESAPVTFSATPAADGEMTIVHAQGETVVPLNPTKVIAFDMTSVDIMTTLGIDIIGLPKANPLPGIFEIYNDDAYANVGSLFEPDYEMVSSLEPDLILVANRSAAVLPDLEKIAPTIDLTAQNGDVIADLRATTTIIGSIFGKDAEAAVALAEIDDKVAALQSEIPDGTTSLVLMVSGGSLTALAPGGVRGGLVYDTLGLAPPVDDLEAATHGEAISFEFLLEYPADWLLVIDRDAATGEESQAAAEVLDNDIVHETSAWQNDQIIYVDPYNWYIVMNGLNAVNVQLDELAPVAGQ